ncbi:glycosyltransferase family protein [Roseivirga sp. BDSF3-8]|uniref:glycosyltransferase family protein n=1 Tax=Roseivirga sp. BDSF3-8 TaxID=3241598 RepID=UPI0035325349
MRYLFIVQGEGRGHMTQAMTLYDMLRKNGHEVRAVIAGTHERRQLPSFFSTHFTCPVYGVASPSFVTDEERKGINLRATITQNLLRNRTFIRSLRAIHHIVTSTEPDVIINFYDFLGGLYSYTYRPRARYIVIGHQYLSHHPDFPFAEGRVRERRLLLLNNRITSFGAEKKLALSFRNYAPHDINGLHIVPPLVRCSIKELEVSDKGYLLAYLVNHGYASQVRQWHARNRHVQMHCFWDHRDCPEAYSPHPNLTFHPLDGQKFMQMMASCTAYASTAGFESVCEAMYLGKPAMLVPVEGHYEQACNALDACLSGAGVTGDSFDLDQLLSYLPEYVSDSLTFKSWVDSAEAHILPLLTKEANRSKGRQKRSHHSKELA